jgi:Fic family protein
VLRDETDAAVRVVLGHFVFVYIHPYIDGNGRMGRFLMNVMMAAGGYPWTVIPTARRRAYMTALEHASVGAAAVRPTPTLSATIIAGSSSGDRSILRPVEISPRSGMAMP